MNKKNILINEAYRIKLSDKGKSIKLRIKKPVIIQLNIRKTLSGDYMVYDHPLFDIAVMPKNNKIITFPKKGTTIDPYPSQDDFLDFLFRRGMIIPDSIQAGNLLGALEAIYPINDEVDTVQTLLVMVHDYVKEKEEEFKTLVDYEYEVEDMYADPDDEDSTELGQVPHKIKKGSIGPWSRPYGLIYRL